MDWKYCFGFEDNVATQNFDISVGCGYTLGAFVICPVVILPFTVRFFTELIRDCLKNNSMVTLSVATVFLIGFWIFWIVMLNYASWYFSKFRFDAEGVQLRSLFRVRRTIRWSDIRKAAVYDVYWGRTYIGIPFILLFLDPEKRPIVLHGDHDGFYKRKYFAMIIATEENVKAFESFWGAPLEKGVQIKEVYSLETHPFEDTIGHPEEQRGEGFK